MPKVRPYLYYDQTVSLCEECLRRVEAKHVIRDGEVWLYKWCPEHGPSKVLVATDAAYWRLGREVYIKPPEMPLRFNTQMHWGCPYDCGLCPDHMQHSCLTIVEVTDHCNLRCPSATRTAGRIGRYIDRSRRSSTCSTRSSPTKASPTWCRSPAANPRRIRISSRSSMRRGEADSPPDGEHQRIEDRQRARIRGTPARPTSPDSRSICSSTRSKPARSARCEAPTCARSGSGRSRALNEVGLSTTLVMTVARGVNDDEIGRVVEFAAQQPAVRGVTLQPVQFAGRVDGIDVGSNRLTLTEVRSASSSRPRSSLPRTSCPCRATRMRSRWAMR